MTALSAATPTRAAIRPTPRLPPFVFDDSVPADWFAGDPGMTAAWNALGILAGAVELHFIDAGRWLIDRIDDPEIADITRRFVRQESYHSTVHARFDRALAARGLPVKAVRRFVLGVSDSIKARGGERAWLAAALAMEQLIGEAGHVGLSRPEVMQGAAEAPRALWMWHFYEEVEHQAALHDGWAAVFGDDRRARDLRVLGAAYTAMALAVIWPLATQAMLPAEARGRRYSWSMWRATRRRFFGRGGLLRRVLPNLRAMLRVGFHPHDDHDPQPLLDAWQGRAVEADWARPVRAGRHGEKAGQGVRSGVRPGDVGRLALFGFDLLRHGWRLRRAVRSARQG